MLSSATRMLVLFSGVWLISLSQTKINRLTVT